MYFFQRSLLRTSDTDLWLVYVNLNGGIVHAVAVHARGSNSSCNVNLGNDSSCNVNLGNDSSCTVNLGMIVHIISGVIVHVLSAWE